MKKKISLTKIIDIILIILLLFISIKKGGFYKSDSILFNLCICILGLVYVGYKIFKSVKNREYKLDFIAILLMFFPVAYMLPIIFKNYSNLSDSIFEMIRYINIYVIYKIVKSSSDKKIYINGIITITLVQCLIGIDGIANRYLKDFLSIFESGFLSRDLTRISSTLQYANVLAILCAISVIFVIDKISKMRTENENKKYSILKYLTLYVLTFIFTTTIILTGSRLVMLLLFIGIFVYIILNKKSNINMMIIVFTQLIASIIYSTVIYNFMGKSQQYIYIIFAISVLVMAIIGFFSYKIRLYFENKEKTVKNLNAKKRYTFFGILLATFIYVIVGMNLPKDLKVYSDPKENDITRNLYTVVDGKNNISFKVNSMEEDTRYTIVLESVDKNFNYTNVKTFNYYDNISGDFKLEFDLNDGVKFLAFKIKCSKGSLKIDEINLNDKKQKLDYYILPTETIFRIKDSVNGSSSIRDRIAFCKDSVKIALKSPTNFVIGIGGEGFGNTYETVQSFGYVSSETHSFVLQLFVESGIIGVLLLCILIILVFKCTKSNTQRFVFLILLIHSAFDLNMSYMFMMSIFAVLLGLLETKDKYELNEKIIVCAEYFAIVAMLFFSTIILVKANMSYNTKITVDENISLSEQMEIVSIMENMVNLDSYDVSYRKKLNDEYDVYLKMLNDRVSDKDIEAEELKLISEVVDNVVYNLKQNADDMIENDKYNKHTILKVSNIYFKNLELFVNRQFPSDKEAGYKKYLDYIVANIEYINTNYNYSKAAKDIAKSAYENYYEELREKNKVLKSKVINSYINLLQEKVK